MDVRDNLKDFQPYQSVLAFSQHVQTPLTPIPLGTRTIPPFQKIPPEKTNIEKKKREKKSNSIPSNILISYHIVDTPAKPHPLSFPARRSQPRIPHSPTYHPKPHQDKPKQNPFQTKTQKIEKRRREKPRFVVAHCIADPFRSGYPLPVLPVVSNRFVVLFRSGGGGMWYGCMIIVWGIDLID